MSFEEVVISPKNSEKGRAFRALHVASVSADALWELGGDVKHDRPVYAAFAASEGEIRPFVANLLCGRPAVPVSDHTYRRRGKDSGYEFMRSAGYKVAWQRHEEGTVATVYLPELLALDPGMVDPKGAKFVVVPGAEYLAAEARRMPVAEIVAYVRKLPHVKEANEPDRDRQGHVPRGWEEPFSRELLVEMVPLSYLFTLYLSNRTRAPIPPDGRFYLQLLLACLKQGLASFPTEGSSYGSKKFGRNENYKFSEVGAEDGKLGCTVAFMATHEEVEATLAAECESYFQRTRGK